MFQNNIHPCVSAPPVGNILWTVHTSLCLCTSCFAPRVIVCQCARLQHMPIPAAIPGWDSLGGRSRQVDVGLSAHQLQTVNIGGRGGGQVATAS